MRDLELDREAPQTPSADARHAERAPENNQNPNLPYDLNPDHHLNHRRPLKEHHLNRPLNELIMTSNKNTSMLSPLVH